MDADRERWNPRYVERSGRSGRAELVTRWCPAGPGNALDVACGDGGNCELLADAGFEVDAVDISEVALARLAGRAHIHPICADLDVWRPPAAHYQVVLMIMFFDRRLLPALRAALVPGGRAIMQCFGHAPDGALPSQSNPDHAARPGELVAAFSDCRVLHEALVERPRDGHASRWLAQLVLDAPGGRA